MTRIWFTAEDLARTQIAAPDPFAETVLSVVALRGGFLPEWQRRVRPRLTPPSRPIMAIHPGRGLLLDLVSAAGPTRSFEEGLDTLLGAGDVLDAEIRFFADVNRGIPAELRHLLPVAGAAPRDLAVALRAYHDSAVGPYWPQLGTHLQTQRERTGQIMADGGLEHLFASLEVQGVRWKPPVLEIPDTRPGRPSDYHLGGRGLLFVPSIFIPHAEYCRDLSGRRRDLLIYRVPLPTSARAFGMAVADRTLSALLGATRAKVLAAAAGGARTTDLSRRAGVPLSSASEHARALRDAGLLRTERTGTSVRHSLTELGSRLLDRVG